MKLPVKKYFDYEEIGNEVFTKEPFEKCLLVFLSRLSDLYKAIEMNLNKKELMKVYVRGFQAILGIGIALKAREDISQPNLKGDPKVIEDLFFDIYEKALNLRYTLKDHTFYSLFSSYLVLGDQLGFNFDDITYVYEKEKDL